MKIWIKVILFIASCLFFVNSSLALNKVKPITKKHQIMHKKHRTKKSVSYMQGIASHYAVRFDGRKTASGDYLDLEDFTAAHPTLPLGTKLKVINLKNQKIVYVEVNDRMPKIKGRVIDLSFASSKLLGIYGGLGRVKLEKVSNTEFKAGLKKETAEYNLLKTIAVSGLIAKNVVEISGAKK